MRSPLSIFPSAAAAAVALCLLLGCGTTDEGDTSTDGGKAQGGQPESASDSAKQADGEEAKPSANDQSAAPSADQPKPAELSAPELGKLAPDFHTTDQDGSAFHLASFRGKQPVAIVFYPKDDTRGCTKQLCSLRDGQAAIDAEGVKVVAISFDSAQSHDAFREKHGLTTPILMDEERAIGSLYGVVKDYGNGMLLPERKTFVIAKDGTLVAVISEIDFENHGAQIIAALEVTGTAG